MQYDFIYVIIEYIIKYMIYPVYNYMSLREKVRTEDIVSSGALCRINKIY